jgi:lipopolysaccharide export system protein LptA
MRRSEATRYARWAAAMAALLTCVVIGVYAYRQVEAHRIARRAPPVVPETVQKRSAGFSFSKVEQERTLFTVRASRTTEFKEGGKALLEDVWITIYGRKGRRFDNIHTRECDYVPSTGRITCAGEVQMDLESAEEARANPGQRAIHIGTSNVSFERETGIASTASPVVFRFPYGHGRGTGASYSSRDAVFRLERDVQVTLTSGDPEKKAAEPVVLIAGALEYHRDSRTLRLLAPVEARQGQRSVSAGRMWLEFDASLRAQRLVATGDPRLDFAEPQGEFRLTADHIETRFLGGKWLEAISAKNNVQGQLKNANGEQRLRAQALEITFESQNNLAREVTASGGARLEFEERGAHRALEAPALRFSLAAGKRPRDRHITAAETIGAGTLTFREGNDSTVVRAEKFAALFNEQNTLRQLDGTGSVNVERRIAGQALQTTSSREIAVRFSAGGAWAEIAQTGDVRFREGERSAQAERAVLQRASDRVTLSGNAVVSDAVSRTTAATLTFQQRSGEIRGAGGVRTSYFTAEREGVTNLAPQPAHISAESLTAGRDTGRALYSGNARLWQGDAVIEAGSIELFRKERRLEARGRVNAIVPQAAETSGRKETKPVLWRTRASRLDYWAAESRARLEENASAVSELGEIHSRAIELFFAARAGGGQQLARGVATGGVRVLASSGPDQRRATSERAEYTAAEGKFVLSGGNPTLFDPVLGFTTGRQLTFFLADDKILVESDEGSRTLSRHRVGK